jgi:hypothetical protein
MGPRPVVAKRDCRFQTTGGGLNAICARSKSLIERRLNWQTVGQLAAFRWTLVKALRKMMTS